MATPVPDGDAGQRARDPLRAPPPPTSEAVRAVMLGNRGMDTSPEMAVRRRLHRLGLRYRVAFAPVRGLRCRPDIVFTRARVAVFIDGCFWHGCPAHGRLPASNAAYWRAKIDRNADRDRRQDAALSDAGWRVLRYWEHEDSAEVASAIAEVVRASG